MIPAVRVTGGSVHFAAAGWVALVTLDGGVGGSVAGNVITNNGTEPIYFSFSDITDVGSPPTPPAETVGPGNGNLTTPTTGDTPVGAGDTIVIAQPDSALWWGIGGTVTSVDVTPVEVINT